MMKVVRSLDALTCDPTSVVTVGTFDGVHMAHREIVKEVVSRARSREGRSVVMTFDPHPREIVGKEPVEILSTLDERIELLGGLDVDVCFVIPFTFEFSRLAPREFYETYVVRGSGVSEVIVGYDHMFGRDREAGLDMLLRMGEEFHFSVSAVQRFIIDGETVSSSLIRRYLETGDVEMAAIFLGYRYAISGIVVRGDGRGRNLGFPTANIRPSSDRKLLPGNGVYVVHVVRGGREYFGMLNIGLRPTVSDAKVRTIEVHLFDFEGDVYGEQVVVTLYRRLRGEQQFASIDQLVAQLKKDEEASREYLAR